VNWRSTICNATCFTSLLQLATDFFVLLQRPFHYYGRRASSEEERAPSRPPTSLRIRQPGPRLGRESPPAKTREDLADIPARASAASTTESGHIRRLRGPANSAVRLVRVRGGAARHNRDPLPVPPQPPPPPPLPGSFDGWNKKMGGALNAPGPDLSPGRGRRGRTLGTFPSVPFSPLFA